MTKEERYLLDNGYDNLCIKNMNNKDCIYVSDLLERYIEERGLGMEEEVNNVEDIVRDPLIVECNKCRQFVDARLTDENYWCPDCSVVKDQE